MRSILGSSNNKLIYGLGNNDKTCPSTAFGRVIKEYDIWRKMLLRCTDKFQAKYPTYLGTTCSDNFKSYSYFYEWCQTQVGFGRLDEKNKVWQIDKDLLSPRGSKVYSEDTCVFIPQRINSLLTKRDAERGCLPIGVFFDNGAMAYRARCSTAAGSVNLGTYETAEDAFQAYKTFKEVITKSIANKYRQHLDPRAYQALMVYTVNIKD